MSKVGRPVNPGPPFIDDPNGRPPGRLPYADGQAAGEPGFYTRYMVVHIECFVMNKIKMSRPGKTGLASMYTAPVQWFRIINIISGRVN